MIIPKLAFRNLFGAGVRTWLNVVVLSFSFVLIIWTQGLYKGMNNQVERAMIDAEIGGGQYWHEKYDPYDPLSLEEAHQKIPARLQTMIANGEATPILITQGSIYPNGRIRTVLLKGIDPAQTLLDIPAHFLTAAGEEIPALIGTRMAKSTNLKIGDYVTIRWRDADGTFDAKDARIVQVMKTPVQTIDNNQIWLPLQQLQQMTRIENEATLFVVSKKVTATQAIPGWQFRGHDFLLKDLRDMVRTKSVGASIMYAVFLFLAMLAIFDTQVLSIFRRRREMGTLMALGMTRLKVIQLFTFEGAMHGVLAALIAAVYGIPLLTYSAVKGWALPGATDSYGFAIGEKIFPVYGAGLIVGTTLLVLVITTIVSYLPTRRIAKLKPTDALRGRTS